MAHYILAIDKIYRSDFLVDSNARLRFDVSSCTSASDPNNNVNQTKIRNIACFEILEEGVKCVKVCPVAADSYEVEYIKGCDPDPTQSASVQIIHKRHGTLADSNENVAFMPAKPFGSGGDRYPRLTTFQAMSLLPPEEPLWEPKESRLKPLPILTEDDIQNFSQFTFKLHPVSPPEEVPEITATPPPETIIDTLGESESEGISTGQPQIVTPASPEVSTGSLANQNKSVDGSKVPEPISSVSTSDNSIALQWIFDDVVSVTIELHNLMYDKQLLKSTQGMQNIAGYTDINYNTTQFGPQGSSAQRSSRLKDLKQIAHAQLASQKKEDILMNQVVDHFPATSRALIVRKFIKDMIVQRLLTLGVQHLDCNEIIDAWQSKQIQCNYYTFPFFEDYQPLSSNCTDPYSPNISKPNSSLFRLTPSGHISRSIFSTFARQVDALKSIICNATCTLIHSSVQLLLPEIKLLKSRQLETNSNPQFITEWIRLILLAANGLKPSTPEDVAIMVDRELGFLKTLARDVYQVAKKVDKKIQKLSRFSEEIFHKSIHRIHPKSLKKLNDCTNSLKNNQSPNVIHYNADQLQKISIHPKDLLKDHIFFSETTSGELLFKSDIDSLWNSFDNLEFVNRRLVFLALAEDLQMNLKSSLNTIQHLQEIYTAGYPTSIKTLLKDVINELEFTSKREDLTVLIKTSLVTHISCLYELLTRLQFVSREMSEISKNFYKSLKAVSYNPTKIQKESKGKFLRKVTFNPEVTEQQTKALSEEVPRSPLEQTQQTFKSGIEHSNAQLVIPLRLADFQSLFNSEDHPHSQD